MPRPLSKNPDAPALSPSTVQSPPAAEPAGTRATLPPGATPREIGGRGGLDPTRYGDWEKNGRCIDF
ncbi:MAG TPA: DUF1674 domain-containing protein [Candidatus Dormibacteraeota bacterium]|nr:DUF1674 domain-containing protein [Candidatus Dormibacteraeota bacterium]